MKWETHKVDNRIYDFNQTITNPYDNPNVPQQNTKKFSDPVNHPAHYTEGNIEAIDYMLDSMGEDNFVAGCEFVIKKYLHRWRSKNGVEDLKKAQWYLNKMIKVLEGQEEKAQTGQGQTDER